MIAFTIGAWVNFRRARRTNYRAGLRWAAFAICLYGAVVYLFGIVGIIPDVEIRLWMRWFQFPVAIYMIVEGLNG
jgi:hypothetical protein